MNILKFNSCLTKTTKYFLYLIIFLLPIQTRWIIKYGELNNDFFEYGTISLYLVDILLILLITLLLVDHFLNKETLKLNKNKKIIGTLLLLGVLELAIISSIVVSPNKLIAALGYFKFTLSISLFFIIIYTNYNLTKLIYAFLVGVFLQATLGIWQFLTQNSFANKWLGMAAHDPTQPGTSVIETLGQIMPDTFIRQGERWLRSYGSLDHPNILGGLLAISILLLIQFYIKKTKPIKNSIRYVIIFYTLICAFSTCLFFTFSRTAWLGLSLSIVTLFIIIIYKKQDTAFKKLFEISSVIALLFIILFSQFSNIVLTRLNAVTRLEIKSNQERITSYDRSFKIIKENWFFGVGIGNYTLADKNLDLNKNIINPSWHYQPVHNAFLLIWAEIGIIGLLIFISFIIWIGFLSFKNNLFTLPIILTIFIAMMLDHWLWSTHFGFLLFYFTLGIILKKSKA